MARGAGGLRGSGTRGRRAHGPAPAPTRAPRTFRGRSAAATRLRAAIFPTRRPARPCRAPARPRPAPGGRGPERRTLIGPRSRGRGYASPRPQLVTAAAAPSRRPARLGLGACPAAAAPSQGGGTRALPRELSVSGSRGSQGLPARAVSPEEDWKARPCARASGTGRGPGKSRGRQAGKGGGPLRPALSGPTREPGLSEAKRLTYVIFKTASRTPCGEQQGAG